MRYIETYNLRCYPPMVSIFVASSYIYNKVVLFNASYTYKLTPVSQLLIALLTEIHVLRVVNNRPTGKKTFKNF